MNDEIATAPAMTILNSLNSLPVIPSMNTIGKKTAISVIVVAIMAKKISFEPSMPALIGFIPPSILT